MPSGKVGIEKLGEAALGRTAGVEMKGRLPGDAGLEGGNAGASKVVSASAADKGSAFNIVAASESEGRSKREESTPEGGVCRALPTSLLSRNPGFSGSAGTRWRDSGESLGFFVSRDGSLGLSNRHLYIGPAWATETMQQTHALRGIAAGDAGSRERAGPGAGGLSSIYGVRKSF